MPFHSGRNRFVMSGVAIADPTHEFSAARPSVEDLKVCEHSLPL